MSAERDPVAERFWELLSWAGIEKPDATDDGIECPECHGNGVVEVGGYSVNPGTGTLVSDPQQAHDETCPACAGWLGVCPEPCNHTRCAGYRKGVA